MLNRGSRSKTCYGGSRYAFGSYQGNEMEGLASAIRIMKESHADALKLEGGEEIIDTVKRIISAGIPVMGHLGLMPQSINKYGTYTVRAKDDAEADKLIRDAHLLEEAGCFAIVLEKIPATCRTCSCRTDNPYYRYWCRWSCRRSGIGYSGYAWDEQRIPSAFPSPLCRFIHGNDRRDQPLRIRREELLLPQREGTILR